MKPNLRIVTQDAVSSGPRYPIKHRASQPGYDWPIRWEHEREDRKG
jgi:hypothetical protein